MIAMTLIAFCGAVVNGALGYGFSSIAVPLSLLLITSRVLNPAIVLLEVLLNAFVLWNNRDAIPDVWRRVAIIIVGVAPGVILGTTVLSRVDPRVLKLGTFAVLLPLILLQAAGYRRPMRAEKSVGLAFGAGVGTLYAVTTISGPPLAMFLNNQGLAKQRFRAALGLIRVAESVLAAALYARADLFSTASVILLAWLAPGVLIGVPVGAWLSRRVKEESFRRVCMSFDGAIVALGASAMLRALHIVDNAGAYLPFGIVLVFNVFLLYRFFRVPVAIHVPGVKPQCS